MKWAWHLSNPTKATQLLSSKSQRKKYTMFHETMKILKKKIIFGILLKFCVGVSTVSMLDDSSVINLQQTTVLVVFVQIFSSVVFMAPN